MELIYISPRFHRINNTMSGLLYDKDRKSLDWEGIETVLENGENVQIRPATTVERESFEQEFTKWREDSRKYIQLVISR